MTRASFPGKFGTLALLGLVTLPGCGGDSVDLGETPGGEPPRLDGRWVGTVSGDLFVTSPKRLTLELDEAGKGTLLVGEAALDPPSDPLVGYPPEAEADAGEATGLLWHLYDGVSYEVHSLSAGGRTAFFELDAGEAFTDWCSLQTPLSTNLGYKCRPNLGVRVDRSNGEKRCFQDDLAAGTSTEGDCLAIYLCSMEPLRNCTCTASECSMSDGQAGASFALTLSADENTLGGDVQFVADGTLQTTQDIELVREGD